MVSWVRCGTFKIVSIPDFCCLSYLSCSPACGCETDNELCENIVNLEVGETMDNVSSDSYLD